MTNQLASLEQRDYFYLDPFSSVNLGTYIINICMYTHLLKTELRISDFQHFHWFAGHRLSLHIPAVPNMVKEHVSYKTS